MKKYILLICGILTVVLFLGFKDGFSQNDNDIIVKVKINNVKWWAYNIQHVDTVRQHDELVGTHFDLYVLEPVVTEKGKENFDIAKLVRDIKAYNKNNYNKEPLVLAYIDIGQAEDWRWYWGEDWGIGNPEWIVATDPNKWEGNYPVAYWYPEWQNIVIYGYKGRSHVEEILEAGFDGIYMDWVEAFSDEDVIAKADSDGINTASAMFDFIAKIRNYARIRSQHANPQFLIVAQNASDLHQKNPARYENLMDAIALEAVWYDGDGGFDHWPDPRGYNILTNDLYPGWTEEVLSHLKAIKGKMPIFIAEYAQNLGGKNYALRVYNELAPHHGFIPYCTRRSLARLSKTPYPKGYDPIDY